MGKELDNIQPAGNFARFPVDHYGQGLLSEGFGFAFARRT